MNGTIQDTGGKAGPPGGGRSPLVNFKLVKMVDKKSKIDCRLERFIVKNAFRWF